MDLWNLKHFQEIWEFCSVKLTHFPNVLVNLIKNTFFVEPHPMTQWINKVCQLWLTPYVYFWEYVREMQIFVKTSLGTITTFTANRGINSQNKQDCSAGEVRFALVERNEFWFYQLFAVSGSHQTWFKLSSGVFNVM